MPAITIGNTRFRTLRDALELYGVSSYTHSRLRDKGASHEQALGIRKFNEPKEYWRIIDGHPFNTISEAANHYDLKTADVRAKLDNGWTARQALNLDPAPETNKLGVAIVRFNGIQYEKVSELAKATGILQETIHLELASGKSLLEILEERTDGNGQLQRICRRQIIPGTKHGKLTAITAFTKGRKYPSTATLFECVCGDKKVLPNSDIWLGKAASCGC